MTDHQDWKPVIFSKVGNSGSNNLTKKKQFTKEATLDAATDAKPIKSIASTMSKQIIAGRNAKKMKQSDLAKAINVQTSIITDYENGKAKPDSKIINKISKALGIIIKK
tara:strand:- start:1594 stop:1920 length:327 start_codon:yes stop_codon:yes gene_type:complete